MNFVSLNINLFIMNLTVRIGTIFFNLDIIGWDVLFDQEKFCI